MTTDDVAIRFRLDWPTEDRASVLRVDISQAIDAPYLAVIDVHLESAEDPCDLVLGDSTSLTWEGHGGAGRLAGIIRSVQILDVGQDASQIRIQVVPALSLLSLRTNTRMFHHKSAIEIVEQVLSEALGEYERELEVELDGQYATREVCVQYQESDLDFVHRLLEEEGIAYCFDHEGAVERMILRDRNEAYEAAIGAEAPITFAPHDLQASDEERVYAFRRAHTTEVTSVTVRDFDWSRPSAAVSSEVDGRDALGRRRESYEHGWARSVTIGGYDEGQRHYEEEDAAHRASIRHQAHQARVLVAHGEGRVVGFAPGRTFELTGHPVVGLDGSYLITRVRHVAGAREREIDPGRSEYHNTFECIPLDVPHRPLRRTPKPSIAGIQTATVTGPAGEEIHTDEHGRIKVQFHWDRLQPANDESSAWVRVQQKWAGAGWGFWWLPRMGMEVVVEFVDGDPDRPLVTGAVYDANHPAPYPLPDEKTKSTIRSESTPGGGGFNELRFEDSAGEEEIFAHAQKDYDEVVLNDHETRVHNDQSIAVDNVQRQTIHRTQTEKIGNDQFLTVDVDRTIHVEGDYDESVDGTEVRRVTGDVEETFAANETRSIGVNVDEAIAADETRTLGGNQTETIGANLSHTIAGASTLTVAGALTQTVVGGVNVSTPAAWTVNAAGGFNIVAAGGLQLVGAGGWKVAAPGGVLQVDSTKDWVGYLASAKGAFRRSVSGMKIGAVGVKVSYVNSKVGFTGMDMPQLGCEITVTGYSKKTFGAKIEVATVRAKTYGVSMEN